MIDTILAMYEAEMKILASQMGAARKNKDMYEYGVLSAKWDELCRLFNNTIKIINGD